MDINEGMTKMNHAAHDLARAVEEAHGLADVSESLLEILLYDLIEKAAEIRDQIQAIEFARNAMK